MLVNRVRFYRNSVFIFKLCLLVKVFLLESKKNFKKNLDLSDLTAIMMVHRVSLYSHTALQRFENVQKDEKLNVRTKTLGDKLIGQMKKLSNIAK